MIIRLITIRFILSINFCFSIGVIVLTYIFLLGISAPLDENGAFAISGFISQSKDVNIRLIETVHFFNSISPMKAVSFYLGIFLAFLFNNHCLNKILEGMKNKGNYRFLKYKIKINKMLLNQTIVYIIVIFVSIFIFRNWV